MRRLLPLIAFATVSPHADAVEIAPGVELVSGEFVPGQQPDGNSILFHTSAGLVVMDTGRHAAHTQKIIDAAAAAHQPIVAVINSHWHLDHIGGNPRIRAAFPDAHVYASDALFDAQKGFLANYHKQLEQAIGETKDERQLASYREELARIDAGAQLAPDKVVRKDQTLRIGARTLQVHLQKHSVTAGDIWVFDPATRVLATGDLVTLPVPFFDTACPAHWKVALDELSHVKFSQLVPGHGAPMSPAQFATYRDAFDHLLVCSATAAPKAQCIDGWITDAAALLPQAQHSAAKSMLDYYMDSALRGDAKKVAVLCGA
jgi:glyoxylase-like metal-dependent hydrolase (beta-lactamase superfamily II)